MSLADVRAYLAAHGREHEIIELDASSATVELAAAAIGVAPEVIAKTLSIYAANRDSAILIVTAGDAKLSNGQFKRRFGHKPHFVAATDVEAFTGHPPGGVCPFANPAGVEVWLDESLKRFDVVYPAAGSPQSAIGLGLEDLERLSSASGWVDVTVR